LFAQIVTGSISGTVQDSSGLAVAAAEVSLTQSATGLARRTSSDIAGTFVFPGLEAGEYSLSISKPGFKRSETRDIHLTSGQRLAVGSFALDVGAASETITVRAESAAVQTQSAERASVITSSQIDGLLIQGRNPTSLVGLLPGVVVIQESQSLD